MIINPWLVAVACVVAVAYAVLVETWAKVDTFAPGVPDAIYPAYEARLLVIDREAIEAAYRAQAQNLFAVWMRDDSGQPARAKIGINRAKAAYVAALEEIARREEAGKQKEPKP